jgi:hypothetical protein
MAMTDGQIKPVTDLSRRAIRIGRILDRLGDGKYIITLEKIKNPIDGISENWRIRIDQGTTVRELDL